MAVLIHEKIAALLQNADRTAYTGLRKAHILTDVYRTDRGAAP